MNDVLLAKVASILKRLNRVQEDFENENTFRNNITKQDAVVLNLLRACEASIDIANHIVKEKRRKFKIGRRDALILEPNIKDLGGVFSKSKNASIRFYISDDEHQYPLRMESAVVVGKFWAELVRIEKIPATDPL